MITQSKHYVVGGPTLREIKERIFSVLRDPRHVVSALSKSGPIEESVRGRRGGGAPSIIWSPGHLMESDLVEEESSWPMGATLPRDPRNLCVFPRMRQLRFGLIRIR